MIEYRISAAIEKIVTSHEGVTDFPITHAQILDEVDTLRVRTLQEMDRDLLLEKPYNLMVQTINYTKDNFVKLESGKSYVECPRIFAHEDGQLAIAFIGSTTFEKQYRPVVGRQIRYARADRYNKEEPIAHFKDGKIFFENVAPSSLTLVAIFERPRDLEPFGYNPETHDYPLSNGKIDIIIGKTAESYIRTLYRVRPQPNQTVDLPQGNA